MKWGAAGLINFQRVKRFLTLAARNDSTYSYTSSENPETLG